MWELMSAPLETQIARPLAADSHELVEAGISNRTRRADLLGHNGRVEDEQHDVRVGDRERRELDERLQQALTDGRLTLSEYEERSASCFAARTRRELEQLTRDLPAPEPASEEAPLPSPGPSSSADEDAAVATGDERKSLGSRIASGVFSAALAAGAIFLGSQVLLADDGASIFGSRTVHVEPGQNQLQVGVLFGAVDVVIPEGAKANSSGVMVFGSVDCEAACAGGGESEVTVDGRGAFGSVEIVTPQELAADEADDD